MCVLKSLAGGSMDSSWLGAVESDLVGMIWKVWIGGFCGQGGSIAAYGHASVGLVGFGGVRCASVGSVRSG